ncbi:MAG TPA: hypothetical protein PKD20_05125, partial [Candidatus Saccharibacteria bacterium]|nr:hypothetical protein [Candidatus Saccharibacteria bacterium]
MARISKVRTILMVANVVALIGFAGTSVYFFTKYRNEKEQNGLTSEQKNKKLVEEINKVYDLPEEEPVVAVVTDPEEFKKQYTAFDNAVSGDYLLFFRKARLNVLYRQSEKKVVKTADVIVPITVEIIGSDSAMAKAEESLKEFGTQITVVKTKTDGITQNFVFDVDSDQKAETDSIAKQLSYEVGTTLPAGFTAGAQTEIVVAVSGGSTAGSNEQTTQESTTETTEP